MTQVCTQGFSVAHSFTSVEKQTTLLTIHFHNRPFALTRQRNALPLLKKKKKRMKKAPATKSAPTRRPDPPVPRISIQDLSDAELRAQKVH